MENRPYSIYVDPGHGGKDSGAINQEKSYMEKDINLSMGLLFKEIVLKGDFLFYPYLTRISDRYLTLSERCKLANDKDVNLFISFHCNSFINSSVSGVEVWFKKGLTPSKLFAAEIYRALLLIMEGHNGRGIKEGDLYVLRNTKMPSALIEFEFLSNPEQAEFLVSEENQIEMVREVADATEFFLEAGRHEWNP